MRLYGTPPWFRGADPLIRYVIVISLLGTAAAILLDKLADAAVLA